MLIEVPSENTQSIDLREKLWAYPSLPSLPAYWVLSPKQNWVRRFYRDATGSWQQQDVTQGPLEVPCLKHVLELSEIYRSLEL